MTRTAILAVGTWKATVRTRNTAHPPHHTQPPPTMHSIYPLATHSVHLLARKSLTALQTCSPPLETCIRPHPFRACGVGLNTKDGPSGPVCKTPRKAGNVYKCFKVTRQSSSEHLLPHPFTSPIDTHALKSSHITHPLIHNTPYHITHPLIHALTADIHSSTTHPITSHIHSYTTYPFTSTHTQHILSHSLH